MVSARSGSPRQQHFVWMMVPPILVSHPQILGDTPCRDISVAQVRQRGRPDAVAEIESGDSAAIRHPAHVPLRATDVAAEFVPVDRGGITPPVIERGRIAAGKDQVPEAGRKRFELPDMVLMQLVRDLAIV